MCRLLFLICQQARVSTSKDVDVEQPSRMYWDDNELSWRETDTATQKGNPVLRIVNSSFGDSGDLGRLVYKFSVRLDSHSCSHFQRLVWDIHVLDGSVVLQVVTTRDLNL